MAAAATTLVPPIPGYKIALPSVGLGFGLLWFNLGLKAWSKESDTAPKVNDMFKNTPSSARELSLHGLLQLPITEPYELLHVRQGTTGDEGDATVISDQVSEGLHILLMATHKRKMFVFAVSTCGTIYKVSVSGYKEDDAVGLAWMKALKSALRRLVSDDWFTFAAGDDGTVWQCPKQPWRLMWSTDVQLWHVQHLDTAKDNGLGPTQAAPSVSLEQSLPPRRSVPKRAASLIRVGDEESDDEVSITKTVSSAAELATPNPVLLKSVGAALGGKGEWFSLACDAAADMACAAEQDDNGPTGLLSAAEALHSYFKSGVMTVSELVARVCGPDHVDDVRAHIDPFMAVAALQDYTKGVRADTPVEGVRVQQGTLDLDFIRVQVKMPRRVVVTTRLKDVRVADEQVASVVGECHALFEQNAGLRGYMSGDAKCTKWATVLTTSKPTRLDDSTARSSGEWIKVNFVIFNGALSLYLHVANKGAIHPLKELIIQIGTALANQLLPGSIAAPLLHYLGQLHGDLQQQQLDNEAGKAAKGAASESGEPSLANAHPSIPGGPLLLYVLTRLALSKGLADTAVWESYGIKSRSGGAIVIAAEQDEVPESVSAELWQGVNGQDAAGFCIALGHAASEGHCFEGAKASTYFGIGVQLRPQAAGGLWLTFDHELVGQAREDFSTRAPAEATGLPAAAAIPPPTPAAGISAASTALASQAAAVLAASAASAAAAAADGIPAAAAAAAAAANMMEVDGGAVEVAAPQLQYLPRTGRTRVEYYPIMGVGTRKVGPWTLWKHVDVESLQPGKDIEEGDEEGDVNDMASQDEEEMEDDQDLRSSAHGGSADAEEDPLSIVRVQAYTVDARHYVNEAITAHAAADRASVKLDALLRHGRIQLEAVGKCLISVVGDEIRLIEKICESGHNTARMEVAFAAPTLLKAAEGTVGINPAVFHLACNAALQTAKRSMVAYRLGPIVNMSRIVAVAHASVYGAIVSALEHQSIQDDRRLLSRLLFVLRNSGASLACLFTGRTYDVKARILFADACQQHGRICSLLPFLPQEILRRMQALQQGSGGGEVAGSDLQKLLKVTASLLQRLQGPKKELGHVDRQDSGSSGLASVNTMSGVVTVPVVAVVNAEPTVAEYQCLMRDNRSKVLGGLANDDIVKCSLCSLVLHLWDAEVHSVGCPRKLKKEDVCNYIRQTKEEIEYLLQAQWMARGLLDDLQFAGLSAALREGLSMLLVGPAGSGKSAILKRIAAVSRIFFSTSRVAVTASTGLAASRFEGGRTLHSCLKIPTTLWDTTHLDQLIKHWEQNERHLMFLKRLECLIIDEVSMISAQLLRLMDLALQHVREKKGILFGGLQVILCGDALQLIAFRKDSSSGPAVEQFFQHESSLIYMVTVMLEKIWRQGEQSPLAGLLQQLRFGTIYLHEYEAIPDVGADVVAANEHFRDWARVIHIFATNNSVQNHNMQSLERFVQAGLGVQAALLALDRVAVRQEAQANVRQEDPLVLPVRIDLATHTPVMILANNAARGYFNGQVGRYVESRADTVIKGGMKLLIAIADGSGEGVERIVEVERHEAVAADNHRRHIMQFPVVLAFALTVNKCQGNQFELVEVHCNDGLGYPATNRLYTALSRATTHRGLRVVNLHVVCKTLDDSSGQPRECNQGLAHPGAKSFTLGWKDTVKKLRADLERRLKIAKKGKETGLKRFVDMTAFDEAHKVTGARPTGTRKRVKGIR